MLACGSYCDCQMGCLQLGQPCERPHMPLEVREEWSLFEEFVLFEGDRALLKLLRCGIMSCKQFKARVTSPLA